MHFHCFILNFISPNNCLKQWRVSCFIALDFWRNVLKTSYKGPKVTSGGWCSRDFLRTTILNINTKGISVVILFLVLVHQMCVLDTKKLIVVDSFSFGETSYMNVIKTSKSNICSVTSVRRPQDLNLDNFHKIGF